MKNYKEIIVEPNEKLYGKILIVNEKPKQGFNFGYTIFIPDSTKKETTLMVEGANIGLVPDTLEEEKQVLLDRVTNLDKIGIPMYYVAKDLGFPILYPLFPKWPNSEDMIYTHMLSSNSLNSKTPMIDELGLKRVDIQLIMMIKDAKEILKDYNINIDDKIMIDGFSASAKFANRFAILHPEIVKLVIAGGVSGALTLPLKEINGEKLLWPVGIGNLDELTNEDIKINIEEFQKIRQFYYMGLEDTNDPFVLKPNTDPNNYIPRYPELIKSNELKQMYKYLGNDMIPNRWERTQELYNELGINVNFKSYESVGHRPSPAMDDAKKEIENIMTSKKTNIQNTTTYRM